MFFLLPALSLDKFFCNYYYYCYYYLLLLPFLPRSPSPHCLHSVCTPLSCDEEVKVITEMKGQRAQSKATSPPPHTKRSAKPGHRQQTSSISRKNKIEREPSIKMPLCWANYSPTQNPPFYINIRPLHKYLGKRQQYELWSLGQPCPLLAYFYGALVSATI